MIIIDEAKKSLQQNWALIKKRNNQRDQKNLMNLLPLYTSDQAKLTPLMDKLALAYNKKAWEIKNALFDGKNMEVLKELRD